jgi:hypothetical protein
MNPDGSALLLGVRRFAFPVVSAWLLQVGVTGLIEAAGAFLRIWIAETVNLIIRHGFHDMIEVAIERWPWYYYVPRVLGGALFIMLGLAVAFWVARKRPSRAMQQKALA